MRTSLILVPLLLLLFTFGCSSAADNPTATFSDIPIAESDSHNTGSAPVILSAGTMNLIEGIVTEDRTVMPYLNVTPWVGGNFSYQFVQFIPPMTWEFNMQLINTSGMTVHDVCIVFENTYGKTIQNHSSYMDIFQPWDLDPYIEFRVEDAQRAFPPGIDTEILYLDYPSGASPQITYFIIAHLGGNTGGVYEIYNYWYTGHLTTSGGSATIWVDVHDHQGDVTQVVADTSALTGGFTWLTQDTSNPDFWKATITNSMGAPSGGYTIPFMASSPSTPQYQTYNIFHIPVDP